jgi:hypothetical protein
MLSNLIPLLLMLFALAFNMNAQPDEEPPYLYHYSRMLGGIIVERADGTDSRHLGANVIPPGMTGIAGPGWSPSGRYFAVYGIGYADYYTTSQGAYLIDSQGAAVIEQLTFIKGVQQMEWSPTDDLLLVVGSLNSSIQSNLQIGAHLVYWLINPVQKKVLAEFSAFAYGASDILWELDQDRVRFYIGPQNFAASDQYFEVIMMLNGTVLKEPSTQEAYREHPTGSGQDSPNYYDAYAVSPSGNYTADGVHPTILTDIRTGEIVELPVHTQGTICRTFIWNEAEQYIITLNGTLIAGGGCNDAVLGVTDYKGELWRELGGCSWDFPPCVGWLPARVNLDSLPPGLPMPVQLDPAQIEYEDRQIYFVGALDHPDLRVRCNKQEGATITEGDEALYVLMPTMIC